MYFIITLARSLRTTINMVKGSILSLKEREEKKGVRIIFLFVSLFFYTRNYFEKMPALEEAILSEGQLLLEQTAKVCPFFLKKKRK